MELFRTQQDWRALTTMLRGCRPLPAEVDVLVIDKASQLSTDTSPRSRLSPRISAG